MIASLALALTMAAEAMAQIPPYTVVDRMEPVNLPELMTKFDGSKVETAEEWEKVRRPELLDFFTRNMHGVRPVERPEGLEFVKLSPDVELLDGTIVRKRVCITFRGPRGEWGFNVLAFLPKSDKPVPSFVLICNRSLEKVIDAGLGVKSEFCPADTSRQFQSAVQDAGEDRRYALFRRSVDRHRPPRPEVNLDSRSKSEV